MTAAIAIITVVMQGVPSWHEPPPLGPLDRAEVRAVEVTSDGSVWLSILGEGLARIRGEAVERFTVDDGLASNGVADLHEDSQGRLWAVGRGGLSVFDGTRWVAQRDFAGLVPRVVFAVHEASATGSIWLAANGGAGKLTSGDWSVLRTSDGLPHQVVHAIVVDREGTVWLGCRTGLARLEAGVVRVLFPDVNFRTALLGPSGKPWFGTNDGVYRWDGSTWTRSLEGRVIYLRLVSRDGAIWAGSATSGLYRFAAGEWASIELPARLRGAEVFDVSEAADGSIWIATSLGAVRAVGLTAMDR